MCEDGFEPRTYTPGTSTLHARRPRLSCLKCPMGEEDLSEDGEARCEAMLERLRGKYTTRNIITVRNRKIWQKRGEREAKVGMDPFALMQKMHGQVNAMEDPPHVSNTPPPYSKCSEICPVGKGKPQEARGKPAGSAGSLWSLRWEAPGSPGGPKKPLFSK